MDRTELSVTCVLIGLVVAGFSFQSYNNQRSMVHPVLLRGEAGAEVYKGPPARAQVEETTPFQITIVRPPELVSTPSPRPSNDSAAPTAGPKDLNTATINDLMEANGIGETLARRIVEYRDKNGPFALVSDVQKVSGIGPSRYAEIARVFRVQPTGVVAHSQNQVAPEALPLLDSSARSSATLIDINTADVQTLDAGIPGIGPVLAERIIAERQRRGRFGSVDELRQVSGIGEKRLEQIRGYVTVK